MLLYHTRTYKAADLAKCDPVESSRGSKHSGDASTERKHGLVDGREQGAKDDHACRGQEVSNDTRNRLGSVAEKLRNRLQVANLGWMSQESVKVLLLISFGLIRAHTRVLVSLSSSERYTGR